jgi:plastocyanin
VKKIIFILSLIFVAGVAALNPAFADHSTASVSIPAGSSVPGCEETNACYIPSEVTIDVGGEVTWSNDDSAAHTVTGGSAVDGPSGVFDSGLFMAGATFSHKFEEAGTFNYFCMVHPWQEGTIIVGSIDETTSNISITDKSLFEEDAVFKDFSFRVTRFGDISGASQVDYSTADGTATSDSDYSATSGTLSFMSGQISKVVIISVNGDITLEPDETFFVNLSNCTGCNIFDNQGLGIIKNDDDVIDSDYVQISIGSSVPGCEETNSCFEPYDKQIVVGDTVTWYNADSVFHTVTGGSAIDGPSGVFDSSLFAPDGTFSHTFDSVGTFEYFCMVHPWQEGLVTVVSPNCALPLAGDWTISSSCKIIGNSVAPGNVDLQNDAIVTIENGGTLDIDFATKYLKIHSGSGILIKSGGKIN